MARNRIVGALVGASLVLLGAGDVLATWVDLGGSGSGHGISNNSGGSLLPTMAFDSGRKPHVAWSDATPGAKEVYYAYWTGSAWAALGGSKSGGGVSNNSGGSASPSMALDNQNRPHIAWYDRTPGDSEIFFAYWNGAAWTGLGGSNSGSGITANSGESLDPSLALDSQNRPHIVWSDKTTGQGEINYAYWNGSAWVGLGGSFGGGGVSNNSGGSAMPALALDSQDRPHIVWYDSTTGDTEIYYAYWTGSAWAGRNGSNTGGGITANGSESKYPAIAIDGQDRPTLAWADNATGNYEVYLAYWNGAAWAALGGSTTGGGISNSNDGATKPALSLDGSGKPHVAWFGRKQGGAEHVFYLYWTGSAWATQGTGELGSQMFLSFEPAIALDSQNLPGVAWQDYNADTPEIYFRQWDGGGTPPPTQSVGLADYNGDGTEDLAVFRNGMWFGTYSSGFTGVDLIRAFGSPIPGRDSPEIGEFNCLSGGGGVPDGKTDLIVYRQLFATWEMTLSPGWSSTPAKIITFGTSASAHAPVRFTDTNGDGCNDIAEYSGGCFHTLESPTYSGVIKTVCIGLAGDAPLSGDLNGDGISDLGVFRPRTTAGFTFDFSPDYAGPDVNMNFGNPDDKPLLGDLNGDGMLDLGVYRASSSTFFFTYSPDFVGVDLMKTHGMAGDSPIIADVNGDGKADIGIWRDGVARWFFLCSPDWTSSCVSQSFGLSGDVPAYGKP